MTPKPTSPVTSTRAGEEMSGETLRHKAQGHADFWYQQAEKNEDRREHYKVIASQFQHLADDAGSIQANSSASEKVCDHPSTEKAGWRDVSNAPHGVAVLLGWRDYFTTAWVNEVGFASSGWSRNGVSTKSQHGQATHWMPLPAPPAGQVIAHPANLHGRSPESSEPSLLGRETVREALEFYADPFAWKKLHDPGDDVRVPDFYSETSFGDMAKEALASLSPLKE